MRAWWRRFGRHDAINGIVIVAVAALPFVAGFVSVSPAVQERLGLFAVCNALSAAAVVATLVLGRHVIVRHVAEARRPLVTIVVFQLAAIARATIITALLVRSGFAPVDEFWWRLFGAESSVFVTGLLVSSLVTMARNHSETNQRLVDSLKSLAAARQKLESHVSEREHALVEGIRRELDSALSSLSDASSAGHAQKLQSLIDDVVRPISHQLGRTLRPITEAVIDPAPTRIDWSTVMRRTLTTNPVHPSWTTLWFAVAAIQFFAITFGADFLPAYLIAVTAFGLWLAGGRSIWARATKGRSLVTRGIVFTSIPLVFPIVIDALLQQLFGVALLNPLLVAAQALWFAIVTWSVSLVLSARAMLRQAHDELSDAERKLRRQLATENARARHVDEAVARVLHGPVQSAITAALRRVQSFPDGHTLAAAELQLIRQPIEQSLTLLDRSSAAAPNLPRALDDLAELWSGVVHIAATVSSAADAALYEYPSTSSATVELLRELVSNAIRHGDADTITVEVALDAPAAEVVLRVSNNGHPVPDDSVAGVGTRLLDGMTVRWSRENRAGEVVVSATVPLDDSSDTA